MNYDEYEYEYHDVAENADYIDQDDDIYYNDGTDEPWIDESDDDSVQDEYTDYMTKYNAYYHDITDEIDD